jgi:hypothetical protein
LTELSSFDETVQISLIEEALAYVKCEMETISGRIAATDDEIKRACDKPSSNGR